MRPSPQSRRKSVTPASLRANQQGKNNRSIKCDCLSGKRSAPSRNDPASTLLHMDQCNDPDCMDLEQLKELQTTLDRYTDYDHYEKCCNGHHKSHANPDECCSDDENDDCCDPSDVVTEDCEDCFDDDCDECVDEHVQQCLSPPTACIDDCVGCEEDCEENGHERKDCPQDHHTSWDSCITTCGVCVETMPLPLLGATNQFDLLAINTTIPHITPCNDHCNPPFQIRTEPAPNLMPEPVFDTAMDHWQTFVQTHHCAPDPCLMSQVSQFQPPQHVDPSFGFTFGCDPTIASNQYPWQQHHQIPICATQVKTMPDHSAVADYDIRRLEYTPTPSDLIQTSASITTDTDSKFITPAPKGRSCQWVMPCGSICGAIFTRTEDLKKHVKNSHGVKGTVTCRWDKCSSTFATEAALTGHISKKHLSPLSASISTSADYEDDSRPWKCTVPGCNKSFMYKQVRDDHVASHNGANRMHCPICHQWLNGEGSNFRRHMASHNPKHEHMKCKHQHLGCRRSFPRLDNLRRHEACCKYGKKAAMSMELDDAGGGKTGLVEVGGHHHHNHRNHRR